MQEGDSVVRAFKKYISNAMDGTEDDSLWQSDNSCSDSEAMNSNNEWDPCDINDKDTS